MDGMGLDEEGLGHINSSHTLSACILRHACTSTMQYSYGKGGNGWHWGRERDRDLILLSMDSRTDLTTRLPGRQKGNTVLSSQQLMKQCNFSQLATL